METAFNRLKRSLHVATPSVTTFRFDVSRWPIVVVVVPGDLGSPGDFLGFLEQVSALHRRGPFTLVVDARQVLRLSSRQRHLLAAARARDEERFPGVLLARANVIEHPVLREAIRAVGWLCPPAYPLQFFGNVDDAIAWCCTKVPS
ncbi:MAG: hypothetical protein Q8O67_07120 [Deltaproteobacteria bacterium]|nr:hypothetical protein [Deltaproteobacteria bacterium]